MTVLLEVDIRNGVPIYKQIVESMKTKIIRRELEADSKVPSIRTLAGQLRINPNTIKKAYSHLEQEGYLYTVTGRGSFVKPIGEDLIRTQVEELEKQMNNLIVKAKLNNIDKESLKAMIDTLYKE